MMNEPGIVTDEIKSKVVLMCVAKVARAEIAEMFGLTVGQVSGIFSRAKAKGSIPIEEDDAQADRSRDYRWAMINHQKARDGARAAIRAMEDAQ